MLIPKSFLKKLGKKSMSVLLAVLMIMSTMSVCFGTFVVTTSAVWDELNANPINELSKRLESNTIKKYANKCNIGGGTGGAATTTGDDRKYTTVLAMDNYDDYLYVKDTIIYIYKAILATDNYKTYIEDTSDSTSQECVTFTSLKNEIINGITNKNGSMSSQAKEFLSYVLEDSHAVQHSNSNTSKVNGTVTNTIKITVDDPKGYLASVTEGDYTTVGNMETGFSYYIKMTGKNGSNNLGYEVDCKTTGYHHYIWKAYWDPGADANAPKVDTTNATPMSTLKTYAQYVDNFIATNNFDAMAQMDLEEIQALRDEIDAKTKEIKNYIADAGEGKQDEKYDQFFPGYKDKIDAWKTNADDAESLAAYSDTVDAIAGYQAANSNYGVFNWGAFDEATIKADYKAFTDAYSSLINNKTVYNYFVGQGVISDTYITNFRDNTVAYDLEDTKELADALYSQYQYGAVNPDIAGEEITLAEKQVVYSTVTGYINSYNSYSAQVKNAIFADGIDYLLAFQENFECQVADCIVYFAENVNKDYSAAKTDAVIAEIATAKDNLAALNALKNSVDYSENLALLDGPFANADTFIAYLYSLLGERFTAQVDNADAAYTEIGRPTGALTLEQFSKVNGALSAIQPKIVEFLDGEGKGSLVTQETRDKYEALKNAVMPSFEAFKVNRGFDSYSAQEILIRREDNSLEYFRNNADLDNDGKGEYEVTDENVAEIIDVLEAALKDDTVKSLLGDLINKDENGEPTGEPFELAGLLTNLIEDNLYTDDLLNTIISFLYPIIAKAFADVWAGLPEDFETTAPTDMGDALVKSQLVLDDVDTAIGNVGIALSPSKLAEKMEKNATYKTKYSDVIDVLYTVGTKTGYNANGEYVDPWQDAKLFKDKTDADGKVVIDEATSSPKQVYKLNWGITDRASFVAAASAALSGLEPLLYALLLNQPFVNENTTGDSRVRGCKIGVSGKGATATVNVSIVGDVVCDLTLDPISLYFTVSGNDGWDNVLAPLFELLNLTNIPHSEDLKNTADFLNALLDMVDQLIAKLDANPVETILGIVPNLVYALEADLIAPILNLLTIEINYEADAAYAADIPSSVDWITGILGVDDPVLGAVQGAMKSEEPIVINVGEMLDLESMGISLSGGLAGILEMLGLELPALDTNFLAKAGELTLKDTNRSKKTYTYGGNQAVYIEAYKEDVLVYLVKWALSNLNGLLAAFGVDTSSMGEIVTQIFANLSTNSHDAVAAIVELLNQQEYPAKQYTWFNGTIDGESVVGNSAMEIYLNPNNDWTEEKANYLYNNLEAIVASILSLAKVDLDDTTEEIDGSIEAVLGGAINGLFTDKTLTALAGILAKLDLNELLNKDKTEEEKAKALDVNGLIKSYLGLDLAAVAAQYADIAAELEADPEYVHAFGVTDAASFVDALVEMLEPLSVVLDYILAGENLEITIGTEKVTLLGGEGYTNGLVPLLEALGCEVAADPENALEATLNALVGLINKLTTNDPAVEKDGAIYAIIDLLPGLFYFIASNGLSTTVLNLLQPVLVIVDTIRPVFDVMALINDIEVGEEGAKQKLSEFLGGPIDLEKLDLDFIFNKILPMFIDLDLSGLVNVIYDICNALGTEYTSAAAVANTVNGKAKKGAYILEGENTFTQADLLTVVLSFVLEWATIDENAAKLDELLGTNGIIASLKTVFADVKIEYGTPEWMYWFDGDEDAFNAYLANPSRINTLAAIDWDNIDTNDWDEDTAKYFAENIDVLVDKIIAMINADKEDAPKTLAALLDGLIEENINADTLNSLVGMIAGLLEGVDENLLKLAGYILGDSSTEKKEIDIVGLKAYKCEAEIEDLSDFINELANVLDTYASGLVDWLFFGDDFRFAKKSDGKTDTIVINGGLGYEKGLALILEALGCALPAEANTKSVLGALADRVDAILDDTDGKVLVDEVLELLPNLIYFLNANGAGVAVNNLLQPVNALLTKLEAFGLNINIADLVAGIEVNGEPLNLDLANLSLANVVSIVEGATGLTLDAAENILVNFCTGKISKGEYIYKMEAAPEDTITILLVVALELINDAEFAAQLDEMLGTNIIAGLKDIFAETEIIYATPEWNYMDGIVTDAGVIEYVNAVTAYPNDWTEEKAAELTAQLPALVDTVIKMIEINGTKYESLSALLTDVLADANIFSTATLENLLGLIKNLLGNIDAELLKVGCVLDVKLPELMAYEVPADIDTVAEFADTLAFVLSEYAPGVVEWLLLGRDFKLLVKDANGIEEGTEAAGAYITINGAQGYEEGLALLLEALGCENLPATTGETKAIVSGVLTSLAARIDEIIANPVAEVLDLLPNLIYFLDANGVAVVIENTIAALMALIDKLSVFNITLDINSLVDLPALMGIADKYAEGEEKLGLDNLTLTALLKALSLMTGLDFTELENVLVPFALGEAASYTSVSGKTAYKMVYKTEYDKHDMVSVIVSAALRMFVENEENAAKLDEMLGTEIVAKLKDVFADVEIAYTEITWDYDKTGDGDYMLTYPNNWNKDTAKAVTALLKDKEFEALIAGLIDANYDSFSALLNDKVNVFTTANLQAVVDLITNLLAGIDDGLLAAAGLLLDVKVAELKAYKVPEGITTVDAFATELANVLTTYASGVVEWLLLGEDYRFFVKEVENGVPVDFITINGANGYTEGLAVLLEALGVAAPAVIVKDGDVDTTATVEAILAAVAARIDEIFANPVKEVIALLPNLIYFLNTNGVAAVVDNTLAAVYALLDKLTAFGLNVDIKSLVNLKALMGIENTDAKIALDNITIATLLEAVSYMVEDLDLTIVESVLVGFDLGETAAYDTVSTEVGTAKKMTLADYDTVTVIANLLLLTVKDADNEAFLTGLVGEEIYDMIMGLFDMKNIEYQNFTWMYTSEETGGNRVGETFSTLETSDLYEDWPLYGPFYTEEMATYIADNFGEFVDNILYLLGLEINGVQINTLTQLINELLDGSLYNSSNVVAIRDALAGVLASVSGLEVNGKNVGKHIVAVLKAAGVADLEAVGKVKVPEFEKDKEQFVASLCDVLDPLYGALKWLLANEEISFFVDTDGSDLITLVGGEGYKYGIIPLLEVLGCENIMTPDAYYNAVKADGDVLLTSILDPLLARVDKIIENPANEILGILPNVFYFINSNGLDTVVKNTLNAVYSLLKVIEPIAVIDLYALIGINLKTINMNWLVYKLLGILADAGYDFDLKDIDPIAELTVGTLEKYDSLSTLEAYRMVYTPDGGIEGGKKELVTVILRLLVTFLMHEKNAEIVVEFLSDNLGMSPDAKTYLTRLINSIAKVPTTTYLGMDQALAVIYYLFYSADIGAGETVQGFKDIGAEWGIILNELGGTAPDTIGGILNDLLGDDVIDSDRFAPSGLIGFFQNIINWFNKIINWFKNLFN